MLAALLPSIMKIGSHSQTYADRKSEKTWKALVRALSSGPSRGLVDEVTSSPGGWLPPETVLLPSVPPVADPTPPPSPPRGVAAAAMLSVGRLARTLPCEARRGADQAASPFCVLRPREPAAGCRAEAETA